MIPSSNLIAQIALHILDLSFVIIVTLCIIVIVLTCLLFFFKLLAHFVLILLSLVLGAGFEIGVCSVELLETSRHTKAILKL